jgi:hypothetical protein
MVAMLSLYLKSVELRPILRTRKVGFCKTAGKVLLELEKTMKKRSTARRLALVLLSFAGFSSLSTLAATNAPQIYHCEFSVTPQVGDAFTMNGNIVLGDVGTSSDNSTYLTLEPPETSGIDVTARVLITYWTDNGGYYYNPMTLHPRGDTAKTLASAALSGNEQQLHYADSKNTNYLLDCKLKSAK